MSDENEKFKYVDDLLESIFNEVEPDKDKPYEDLRELFDQKRIKSKLSQRDIQKKLDIEYRTLNGIIDGTQRMVDLRSLAKIAYFLELPVDRVVDILLYKLENQFPEDVDAAKKQDFIINNFDLPKLKKLGFIDSITNFDHIESAIVGYFGLASIYDYGKEFINVSYSSGERKPKSSFMRNFWGESATVKLKRINNPYDYNKERLIEYIPSIRWYSTDVKNGLFQVIRDLYKLGVTVICEPYMSTIYVRGATFPVNDKPCIVLTNYTDYYSSLWFALIHEIHHVLFIWEELRQKREPHISDEIDKFDKKEVDADEFAREYLFSSEKMKAVIPQIDNEEFVNRYAKAFDIHPSIIYSFYCWGADENTYKKYRKHLLSAQEALETIDPDLVLKNSPTNKRMNTKDKSKQLKKSLFNGL